MNACKLEKKLEITSLFTLFERKFSDDYYWVGETHDFWELVCILDGQMGIAADRDIYSLKKYNMMLHSPMEFHNLWSGNCSGNIPDGRDAAAAEGTNFFYE